MLSIDETASCAECFFRRYFGAEPDEGMREFIRKAAESGLTIAEFIAAVKAASQRGKDATLDELAAGFRRECRAAWRLLQDPGSR